MNIDRKRLLKQRREKTLQNAKGKRPEEEYFLTALKARCKIHRALKNTQKRKKSDNGSIYDENTNIAMIADNINNLKIVVNNEVNATTNTEDTDIEPTDIDNINTAETEIDKSEDIVMSDNNDDNPAMSDKDSPHTILGNDNAENSELGENSTEEVPSPLIYGRKTNDPTKVKTSKRCRPIRVTPMESPMGNPQVDKDTTGKAKSHAFDPTDVQVHEFFFEGAPNSKYLEGVEEDQILAIQRTIQQKERDEERERNITKKIQEYEQKYDFINKALLESVAQIMEMTKSDYPAAVSRVKSAERWSCYHRYFIAPSQK